MGDKKLLVVVDPQIDFISGVLGSERAEKIVDRIVEKIEKWDDSIYVTMDTHCDETYSSTVEGQRIVKHCVRGSDGWKIEPKILEIILKKDHLIVEKPDTFGLSQLSWHVEKCGYEAVQFIGYCTDICVISNALMLRSMRPSIDISVDALCCCGSTFRAHNEALDILEKCCVDVMNRV